MAPETRTPAGPAQANGDNETTRSAESLHPQDNAPAVPQGVELPSAPSERATSSDELPPETLSELAEAWLAARGPINALIPKYPDVTTSLIGELKQQRAALVLAYLADDASPFAQLVRLRAQQAALRSA
ncbi:MAG: hypothetical protein WA208_21830 [Thermoanaerobaculia bacterium]